MLSLLRHQTEASRYLGRVVEGGWATPLLLHGPEGTGRRFAAMAVVSDLLCEGDRSMGCPCLPCEQIRQGVHPDVHVLAAGEKDIGVDESRELIDALLTYPSQSAYRLVVIEGADRLTVPAANALLKTLEEPPAFARFFLLAHEADRVLPTIRSRCGAVCFLPLPEAFVVSVLLRHEPDPDKALVYARLSEGSIGRALQLWGGGRLALRDKVIDLFRAVVRHDLQVLFSLLDGVEKELAQVFSFLDLLLCDLLMLPLDPARCYHLDRLDALRELRGKVTDVQVHALRHELRELRRVSGTTKVQVLFHLKSIFASV